MSESSKSLRRRRLDWGHISLPPLWDAEFLGRLTLTMGWVYRKLQPYRWLMVSSWLMITLLSGVSALPILLARRIVQDFQGTSPGLWINLAGLAAVIVTVGGLRFLGTLLTATVNLKLRHDLEEEYARRLATAPLSYYESNSSAVLALASYNQIPLLANMGDIALRCFLQAGITIVASLVFLFYTSFAVGLCAVVILPLFLVAPYVLGRSVERTVRQSFFKIAEKHSSMMESLLAVKTIRTLGISERRVGEVSRLAADALRHERKSLMLTGASQFMMDIAFAAGVVILLAVLHQRTSLGRSSLPLGAAGLTGFLLLAKEARVLANGVMELRRVVTACSKVVDFLVSASRPRQTPSQSGPSHVGRLELDAVRYSYDGTRDVLSDVNLVFYRDQITGIVGMSGGGKSTLADLLLRLREPTHGRILVDGLDLANLSEFWLRKTFSFVDQEPCLLNTTIRENMLLGAPELTDREILEVLAAASARDLVESLPEGLDTVVGEGGALLSVGEKQRIALARALAAGPSVLVLDEVTSALDSENEAAILRTLQALKTDRVIILVSHRERVFEVCDRIYRIEEGQAQLVKSKPESGRLDRG